MNKATVLLPFLLSLSLGPVIGQNQGSAIDDAIVESTRREAYRRELTLKLADAQAFQKKGDFYSTARLYDDCLVLVGKIGPTVEKEQQQALQGMITVRLQLAEQAMRRGDFDEADQHAERILKDDPKNDPAVNFKKVNLQARVNNEGRMPNKKTIEEIPGYYKERIQTDKLVQDGKLLYEAGRYDEAEAKLRLAMKQDPQNRGAVYYLDLVMEKKYRGANILRENWAKDKMMEVAQAWGESITRQPLPVPNPYARTNFVHTSKARANIYSKLERIRVDTIQYDGVPLSEVVKQLSDDAKKRDPEKKGLNFIVSANVDPTGGAGGGTNLLDPATGLPITAPVEPVDLGATLIKLVPGLQDISLLNLLDAIVKVADQPIKFSVEDYAVVFSPKTADVPPLYNRFFKIDPNTFLQGLQGVTSYSFGTSGGGGGYGGGGYGGGGYGGGGYGGGGRGGGYGGGGYGGGGRGGYGGGGYGGGGYGGGGYGGGGYGGGGGQSEYVGVSLSGGGSSGFRPGGGGAGRPGVPGQQQTTGAGQLGAGGGIDYLTAVTPMQNIVDVVRQFFTTAGVDLAPPKNIYFNDRLGMLMVRATLQDLDIIEQAMQVLNMSPPQLTIESKFAEVSQDDSRALGFDWYLGNMIVGGNSLLSGGTQPSLNGQPSTANPGGTFPGQNLIAPPTTIAPSATDGNLTQGLRNSGNALFTYTGILTDPQFRVVIRAMEQRTGVDLMLAPKITTLSGRQAQIKVANVQYIVTDLAINQTSGGGSVTTGGLTTGGGAVGTIMQPIAEPIELGPVLDVVPYVCADGYTIQMTLIPTVREFVGYDFETAKIFTAQAQSVSGSTIGNTVTQPTPLPIFRLRQIVSSLIIWDGQTVVMGGLIAENVQKTKDKVPVLGDLPVAGRLFRSESAITKKKNLLIFVTPTIIDPAGNKLHSEEEMPFAQNSIPPQTLEKSVTQ